MHSTRKIMLTSSFFFCPLWAIITLLEPLFLFLCGRHQNIPDRLLYKYNNLRDYVYRWKIRLSCLWWVLIQSNLFFNALSTILNYMLYLFSPWIYFFLQCFASHFCFPLLLERERNGQGYEGRGWRRKINYSSFLLHFEMYGNKVYYYAGSSFEVLYGRGYLERVILSNL